LKARSAVAAMVLTGLAGLDYWPAAVAATSEPEKVQEVTVSARRIELAKRVAEFVDQIAAPENNAEGLARWGKPSVCPLVSGLPRQDGEFILERMSEVARAAGVPLAEEQCRPNLYVLVTQQPEDLLRGMEKRNRRFTFGFDRSFYPPMEMPATIVDEFIRTPRPIRVWYTADEKDAWGAPLAYCPAWQVLPQCDEAHPAGCSQEFYRCGRAIAGGSHLVFDSIWTFSRVFVIVDRTQLKGVTLTQLADYIALSAFAKLKANARLGEAPTILTLFSRPPGTAPPGMSDWDRNFLKSLYDTEQKSRLQRSQIAHQMVREILP
jgi:hypothetical protein